MLEVFARQLLLFGIVRPLTSVLAKLSFNIPSTSEISSFPFSLCHCLVTHLSASDSFTIMALYKVTYLFTYLLLSSTNLTANKTAIVTATMTAPDRANSLQRHKKPAVLICCAKRRENAEIFLIDRYLRESVDDSDDQFSLQLTGCAVHLMPR